MSEANRVRISADGSLKLPREVLDALGWSASGFVQASVKRDQVVLQRIEVDLFAEAVKKPDVDAFDRILKKQEENAAKAVEDFEKKIKDPPKLRPEDRPEFWD